MSLPKKLFSAAALSVALFGSLLQAQTTSEKKYSWDRETETPSEPEKPTPPPKPAPATPAPKPKTASDFEPLAPAPEKRTGHLELSAAGLYVFSLGSDADNQTGWGASVSALVAPARGADTNWQLRYGLEFLYFGTSGDNGPSHETIDTGNVFLMLGGSYAFTKNFELGVLLGCGIGGSYGETVSGGHKERNGNVNMGFQIKPIAVFHLSENVELYAAYRLAYISPFVNTDLIDYRSIDMFLQSAEIGITWRF